MSRVIKLPSALTDAAKWRRFFKFTRTKITPLPSVGVFMEDIKSVFLLDAFDRHRSGMGYELDDLDHISRVMRCPVIMPNQFPRFSDPYSYNDDDISRYGMWVSCAWMEDCADWDGTCDMAWADSYENLLAVDDDGTGPAYPCAFAHISMKQDLNDGRRYRHAIPHDAYLKAASLNHQPETIAAMATGDK